MHGGSDKKIPADMAVVLRALNMGEARRDPGVAFGIPWPRFALPAESTFSCATEAGAVALQSWPLAYWPDGSLKWTGHAFAGNPPERCTVRPLADATEDDRDAQSDLVRESSETFAIDTGMLQACVAKRGRYLFDEIVRGTAAAQRLRIVCRLQNRPDDELGTHTLSECDSRITGAECQQRGPLRAVIALQGTVTAPGRGEILSFTARLYFHRGSDAVRIVPTIVFKLDDRRDFIRGLGVRFDVPLDGELHDRHVRFAGTDGGLFSESVRTLSGLRRHPGDAALAAQRAGTSVPSEPPIADAVASRLHLIPAFGDYTLDQLGPDSFAVRKRTAADSSWLDCGRGRRAPGVGFLGGPQGGVVFAMRDFWRRFPTGLAISGAAGSEAHVDLWFHSPSAPPLDLRPYHDGLGMTGYDEQLEGLAITYEDYEPGFSSAYGVSRTWELTIRTVERTPSPDEYAEYVRSVDDPAIVACDPSWYRAAGAFGALWSEPDRTTPARAALEDELDWYLAYYREQIEQRRWYGFWDYGDVMHAYDPVRHVWRYDVGGFAWDNSELSTDLWLWYAYLRSGSVDAFRMAEAMTRHTGDVDVYHAGRFAGLGSRHNVLHWGCSAKQVRISTALYRRFHYYLTTDEHTGDLLDEAADAERAVVELPANRKVMSTFGSMRVSRGLTPINIGTDWCSFLANWMTAWERRRDPRYRDLIVAGMKSAAAFPLRWFSGPMVGFDPASGTLTNILGDGARVSHLEAVFGAVELHAELLPLVDLAEYREAWIEYCELYNADVTTLRARLGNAPGGRSLTEGCSRLTAYAARERSDSTLAQRAWHELLGTTIVDPAPLSTTRVRGPEALEPVDEAPWVSTNRVAQRALAIMQNLELVPDELEAVAVRLSAP